MSKDLVEHLLDGAAGDGGSAEFRSPVPRVDPDDLLRAWAIERGQAIECEKLLELSRLVIRRLIRTGKAGSMPDLREPKSLIRQIDRRLRPSRSRST